MSKKIIAICGSYGKTTVKEILFQILSTKFKVLQSFGNENTPLGISKLVNKLTNQHQILLLEFGEFVVGDIRGLCKLFPPNIGIITGINNQHNERMGGIDKAIQCMFEMAEFCETLVLNIDDGNVRENWQKYVQKNQEIWFYSSQNNSSENDFSKSEQNNQKNSLKFQKAEFDKENLSWKVEITKKELDNLDSFFVLKNENKLENQTANEITNKVENQIELTREKLAKNDQTKLESEIKNDYAFATKNTTEIEIQTEIFKIHLLGKYAVGNLICGLIIGKKLGLTDLEIHLGLQNIKPIKHRLEPIWNEKSQVLVVDDSYNGNIDGVLEAIEVLTRLK